MSNLVISGLVDAFYIAFQVTISANALTDETCIPVNGAPERCGVFLSQKRFGYGPDAAEPCRAVAEKIHAEWKEMLTSQPIYVKSGTIAWARCKKSQIPAWQADPNVPMPLLHSASQAPQGFLSPHGSPVSPSPRRSIPRRTFVGGSQ